MLIAVNLSIDVNIPFSLFQGFLKFLFGTFAYCQNQFGTDFNHHDENYTSHSENNNKLYVVYFNFNFVVVFAISLNLWADFGNFVGFDCCKLIARLKSSKKCEQILEDFLNEFHVNLHVCSNFDFFQSTVFLLKRCFVNSFFVLSKLI